MDSSDFERRIRAIEQRLNGTSDGGRPAFQIVLIEGCLPMPIKIATAGALRFERQEGESEDSFVERAALVAKEAGERSLVVGGLTGMDDIMARYSTFDEFWEAECAAYYDEIPAVSSPGAMSSKGL